MRSPSRPVGRALLAAATMCLLSSLAACSMVTPEHRASRGYQVRVPVHTLVVRGGTGDVRVTGADTSTVSVTEHLTYRGSAPTTSHTVTDGTLELSYQCHDCGVDYDVTVPRGTALQVADGTGDIHLSGLAGRLTATTDTGNITADGLSCAAASLGSQTGGVRATFVSAPASVHASTNTGSVGVYLPEGSDYAVSATVDTGSRHVTVPLASGDAHAVVAHADTGEVTVAPN